MSEASLTEHEADLNDVQASSGRTRVTFVLIITSLAYVLGFVVLYPFVGRGVGPLAALPVVAAGWLLGLRAGLLAGVLAMALNAILNSLVGQADTSAQLQGLPGNLALLFVGAGIGYLHDLGDRLRQQIAERQRAEAALRQSQTELEQRVQERTAELLRVNEQLEQKIAEHRRAEQELAATSSLLKNIFDNLDEIFFSLEMPTQRLLQLSPASEKIYGRPRQAFIENPELWQQIIYPEDQANIAAHQPSLFAGQPVRDEYRIVRPDGARRWVEAKIQPVFDAANQLVRLDGVISDITARKQADEEIRRQAARAEALARVAARLNAQLDLETVLNAVCEETARALNAPATAVRLYQPNQDSLYYAQAYGLPPDYRKYTQLSPRALFDNLIRQQGPLIVALDVQALSPVPNAEFYAALNIRTVVTAAMIREGQLIGGLNVFSVGETRHFTEDELALLKSLADQAAQAIANARLFDDAERRLKRTQALRNIDLAITGSLELRVTLNVLLDQVTSQLNVDAADILLFRAPSQMLEYAAGRGFRTDTIQNTRRRLGEGNAGRAALERRVVHIPHLTSTTSAFTRTGLLIKENFITYYGVPLVAKGQIKGVLEIFHRAPLDADPEWLAFMEALAGQAAIAIDNATLFDDLQRSNTELALAYETTLEGWSAALDLRDKETEGHTLRVTEMTLKLARAMGFKEDELVQVRRGGLLHDIGKMGIPDNILLKPGPLTDDEWVIMRKHPGYAYELLSRITYLRPALDIPYCHHEKWDGTGYPRGLKGEQIPLAARLFAVVDVWDALRSDRPYRQGWPEEKVREHIRSLSGTHFDPQAVEVFLSATREA